MRSVVFLSVFLVANAALAADGKELFLQHKCNTCHSVPAAGIEAKVKVEKMKGPAFEGKLGYGEDVERLVAYLKKEGEHGREKDHPKKSTASPEDLEKILTWISKPE